MQKPIKSLLILALITVVSSSALFFLVQTSDNSKKSESMSELSPFIAFSDPHLSQGRLIWLENCKGCHGDGTAGAPIPMENKAWEFRIAKGMPTLYEHAIKGFFGENDTMMPERGGNPNLSDEQVIAAVDYVVALATHHISLNRNTNP